MKKIIAIILGIIKGFIINPFWKSLYVLIILGLSLAINGLLWYIYLTKIKANPLPFYFASGLVILNLVLANFLWNRDKLSSYLLIYSGLFVQILMVIFIRYLMITF